MKLRARLFILALGPLGLWAQPASDLQPPQKRAQTLDLARGLLAGKPVDSADQALAAMNPFDPPAPVVTGAEVDQTPQVIAPIAPSNHDLFKKMAEGVNASGMMQLGDRTFLLVGKKKYKVGDCILVNFEGTNYELEVTAIDRTSFTLRLKNEEITRPIKAPVPKP
jgi:hypothetical protein